MIRRDFYLHTIHRTPYWWGRPCNQFANEVMNRYGTRIPPNGNGTTATMYPALQTDRNWVAVTWNAAVNRANQGIPTIAIAPGHIAVVSPSTGNISELRNVLLAQTSIAGGPMGYNVLLREAWTAADHHRIRFYSWAGALPPVPQPFTVSIQVDENALIDESALFDQSDNEASYPADYSTDAE